MASMSGLTNSPGADRHACVCLTLIERLVQVWAESRKTFWAYKKNLYRAYDKACFKGSPGLPTKILILCLGSLRHCKVHKIFPKGRPDMKPCLAVCDSSECKRQSSGEKSFAWKSPPENFLVYPLCGPRHAHAPSCPDHWWELERYQARLEGYSKMKHIRKHVTMQAKNAILPIAC